MTAVSPTQDDDERRTFLAEIQSIDPQRLVFLDETSVRLGMRRTHGYARRGERLRTYRSTARQRSWTLIAAVSLRCGLMAPLLLERGLTKNSFAWWVENLLLPELHYGDVVILDRLRVHEDDVALDLLAEFGIRVIFLPIASPDFNPIEEVWSWLKTRLRTHAADDVVALDIALSDVDDELAQPNHPIIRNYFEHAQAIAPDPTCKSG